MILRIKRPFSTGRHNGTASRLSRMIGRQVEEARWAEAALRMLLLLVQVVLPISGHASGLECPEVRLRRKMRTQVRFASKAPWPGRTSLMLTPGTLIR